MKLICDWCGRPKKKAVIKYNERTNEYLTLCFLGCQNFPEPYDKTEAGQDPGNWQRIDPYQNYQKKLTRLRKQPDERQTALVVTAAT